MVSALPPMTLGHLFQPIEIRGKLIKNRIVQPGQGTGFGHLDGRVSRRHLEFHRAKARGGVGLIIFEHTGIDRPGNVIPLMEPLIDDDRYVPGLREITRMVHDHGATIFFQLGHGGRRGVYSPLFYWLARLPGLERLALAGPRVVPSLYLRLFRSAWNLARTPKGPSDGPPAWGFRKHGRLFEYRSWTQPRALTKDEIHTLVRKHGEAARRAKEAGGDGVEVYCCHGYLLSQFLSPVLNERRDEYGGSVEGRARITLEVIREVRRVVGDDMIVSLRLNGADHIDGGSGIEDAKAVARLAEAAGADVINVTAGVYGSYPPMIPPAAEPQGLYMPFSREIKNVVKIPVIGGIRIVDPVHADFLIAEGQADMILMGRALLADPEMPNKARTGRFDEIRPCVGCNQCLEIGEGMEAGIHCLVNPGLGREWRLPVVRAPRRKRTVVVGGGPAGLTAAEILAERGHEVILFEKSQLGGRLHSAARVPGQDETKVLLDFLERRLDRLGVNVQRVEATAEKIRELDPRAVVVATGGRPWAPTWAGVDSARCLGMDDVFTGRETGKKILVWGDDLYCLGTSLFLAHAGKEVIAIQVPRFFPLDVMEVAATALYLRVALAERGVEVFTNGDVGEIRDGSVHLATGRTLEGIDTIVTCKLERDRTLEKQLKRSGLQAFTIGDARWPRKSISAACEAYELAAAM